MSEKSSGPESRVRAFVAAINAHDPDAIVESCSAGHVFIDSLGNRLTGEIQLRQAWQWYSGVFSDYRIEVDALVVGNDCVLLSGSASARHSASGTMWSIPAAWKAKVTGVHITHWQVYADNKPVYEILNRAT